VEKSDNEGILKATEAVHMNYEQMVRTVRPVVKELDAFHQSLYTLHHYYVPENKPDLIKASADSLTQKMVALNAAALPKRLEAKTEQFNKARKNLEESVKAFAAAVKAKKGKDEIAKLENTLHARYQVLEKVFE
jgi:exonuclease VII small subunit